MHLANHGLVLILVDEAEHVEHVEGATIQKLKVL